MRQRNKYYKRNPNITTVQINREVRDKIKMFLLKRYNVVTLGEVIEILVNRDLKQKFIEDFEE